MARCRRSYSITGMYHVVLKGIDKKWIFNDEQDKHVFLNKLFTAKDIGRFEIIAYCLMDNHVHLVMKEGERLGKSIQRFTVSYVAYYHNKYGTSGHFFANRFHSDPIEEDEYLLSAVRYVHQNPVRAGMTKSCSAYHWSSYSKILRGYKGYKSELSCDRLLDMLGSVKAYEYFHLTCDEWFSEDCNKRNKQRLDAFLKSRKIELSEITGIKRNQLIRAITSELEISGAELATYFELDRKTVYKAVNESKR